MSEISEDVPSYTVHEIRMQYIMVNPIYNTETNALLNLFTNEPYERGGLTLNTSIKLD